MGDCDCLSVYANQCTKLGIGATSQALRGSQVTLNTTLPMPNASVQVFNGSSQTGNGTVTTLGNAGAPAWYYSFGSCWNHPSGNPHNERATCGGDVDWKLYHSNERWTCKDACNHIASLPDHDCHCLFVRANQWC